MIFKKIFFLTLVSLALFQSSSSYASMTDDADETENVRPMEMQDLIDIKRENKVIEADSAIMPDDIRGDAQKEAAFSFGARGGLAWRTWFIRDEIETRARYMDKVFDFRQLLIPAPSGLLIEPPVISEAMDAMLIDSKGMEAAVADRVLSIGKNARIVSAPRTWRSYLEREWGVIEPPPDILRPATDEERALWAKRIEEGWGMGIKQADEIFQEDLNRLVADYQGMVRYRALLAQGMVSPPYALQVDRGVTGGGNEMRIGDRGLSLTELPKLQTGYQEWQPANR